jgi:hypothetical protein
MNINLDCIAMVDSVDKGKGNFTYVFGPDSIIGRYKHLFSKAAQMMSNPIYLDYNQNPFGWRMPMFNFSDNSSFIYNNVPAILLVSGLENLHSPADSPERLNYENMESITQFVFETVRELAYN